MKRDLNNAFEYISSISNTRVSLDNFLTRMQNQISANDAYIKAITQKQRVDSTSSSALLENALYPLDQNNRSAAFICPHWGNYVSTFFRVACSLRKESKYVIFRGEHWDEKEDLLWSILSRSHSCEVFIHRVLENKSLLKTIRRLKSGAHLFVLFDLYQEFGDTTPIDFFNYTLKITYGWAKLCYLSRSIVVFLASESLDRKDIQLFNVIDPLSYNDELLFVQDCMKAASHSLQSLVAEEPAYWFMWEHWEKYSDNT